MLALRRATFIVLVVASSLLFPLVYRLIALGEAPPYALSYGLLSMGLAWSGGCALENRRRGTVRALTAAGLAAPLVTLVPALSVGLGGLERALLAGVGLLCAVAMGLLLRTPPKAAAGAA